MSTFHRSHNAFTRACPERQVSQPLSRVVAGPDLLDGARAIVHSIGGDPLTIQVQGHAERALNGLYERSAPASSLIADVAAFRALTPEQRAALLQIGADGVALLEAARTLREPVDFAAFLGAMESVREIAGRIDARK